MAEIKTDEVAVVAMFGFAPERDGDAKTAHGQVVEAFTKMALAINELPADDGNRDPATVAKKRIAVDAARKAILPVAARRDKLMGDLNTTVAGFEPRVANSEVASSAIWPRLPTNGIDLRIAYVDALERGDWATCNAIETCPPVFQSESGQSSLESDDLAELRAQRIEVEDPDRAELIAATSDALGDVQSLLDASERDLDERSRDLPEPKKDDDVGDDMLDALATGRVVVGD